MAVTIPSDTHFESFTCGLTLDGRLYMWPNASSIVKDTPSIRWSYIACGRRVVCGIIKDGEMLCWKEGGDITNLKYFPEYAASSMEVRQHL